ncbi:hypothetical protein [Streptomyces sp. NPDC056227]|uniref:hypothetical protein n=1 Tax=Streptomyces sp. NPDC056227 TaxID=3345753 RepID=UPI0035D670E3
MTNAPIDHPGDDTAPPLVDAQSGSTTCTCDYIDAPWIKMLHAADCPGAPVATDETSKEHPEP